VAKIFLPLARTAALTTLALLLLSMGCVRTPDELARNASGDPWHSPAADYNATLDGGPLLDVPVTDVEWPQDTLTDALPDGTDLPDTTPDLVDGSDIALPDTDILDTDILDTDILDTDTVTWPTGPATFLSAASPDGVQVRARFNKPLDVQKGQDPTAWSITGSDNSSLAVASVKVLIDKPIAELTLAANAKPNPAVTYYLLPSKAKLKAADGQALSSSTTKLKITRTVYLQLLFHQHQPTYLDPVGDVLMSPWVRKHATKDYYDMASILEGYPNVHLTMNLTAVLLNQLLPYYVDRMGPFVDTKATTMDVAGFLTKWRGHTDPWVDLLLEPTPSPETATEKQLGLLYADPWSCVSTAPVLMDRFPDYKKLREKNPATYTQADFLGLKFWFEIAWMDPDFLQGPVTLATGDVVNLTDFLQPLAGGKYGLKVPLTDELARRVVVEEYKIMKAVVPIHKKLAYHPVEHTGQIELTTTPFYHPILPLVQDTNLMSQGQPFDAKPASPFSYPKDAAAQVGRAVAYFEDLFGEKPRGMWPGEGSVAEAVVQHFVQHKVMWVATDQQVMAQSGQSPGGAPQNPFQVDVDTASGSGGSTEDVLGVYFRNTQMSNDIGFKYQGMAGEDSSNDLIKNVNAQAPSFGSSEDRVITLILDGENAWETFVIEHDGKGFFHKLYSKLELAFQTGEIVTVTGSEYLMGNPERGVPAHPVEKLKELEPLFPGSWIGGTFSTWIGEGEENVAWGYLLQARNDLAKSGLVQPDPYLKRPVDTKSADYHIWVAFDEIYAAEGSDWFWWYGSDMTSPSNDDSPFDQGFRAHLGGMYLHMNQALTLQGKPTITPPEFKPIIQANPQAPLAPLDPPPTLDGLFTPNEGEWTVDGGFFFDSDTSGAEASPDDWFATVYYGFGKQDAKEGVFVGLAHNWNLTTLSKGGIGLYFSNKHIVNAATGQVTEEAGVNKSRNGDTLSFKGKGAARELWIDLKNGKATPEWRKSDGTANWTGIAASAFGGKVGGPVTGGKLLEVFIPYTDLGISAGDPLQMQLVFTKDGVTKDLAPSLEARLLVEDPTLAVFVTFQCDARGATASNPPLDAFGPIYNWPPPNGKGIVYITGNDPKLGMKAKWVPNKIGLRDDGLSGDEKAGDSIWSGVFAFPQGASLKYKYTIGLPENEGQWAGTEEFPLTERGIEITKDPTKKKMSVSDVFADRPPVSGQQGTKTVIKAL
jgi:alpha-amylase/alpha-mannosidase (GH57 family)